MSMGVAAERHRPYVTAPDGRRFFGKPASELGSTGEDPFIASLTQAVNGIAEVCLPAGRADVATDTEVFEVESVQSWRAGAQQAYAYGAMSGLRPHLALFGPANYLPIYLRMRDHMPDLTLLVWASESWVWVTSSSVAPHVHKPPLSTGTPGGWLRIGGAVAALAPFRIGEQTVRRYCDNGTLESIRLGGGRNERRIKASSVDALIAQLKGQMHEA
jgi:hypothetical protein